MIQMKIWLNQQHMLRNSEIELFDNIEFASDFFYSFVCNKNDQSKINEEEEIDISNEDLKRIVNSLDEDFDRENLETYHLCFKQHNDKYFIELYFV
jgi:hypothetical protein